MSGQESGSVEVPGAEAGARAGQAPRPAGDPDTAGAHAVYTTACWKPCNIALTNSARLRHPTFAENTRERSFCKHACRRWTEDKDGRTSEWDQLLAKSSSRSGSYPSGNGAQVRDAQAAAEAAAATIAKLERQYIEERNLRREVRHLRHSKGPVVDGCTCSATAFYRACSICTQRASFLPTHQHQTSVHNRGNAMLVCVHLTGLDGFVLLCMPWRLSTDRETGTGLGSMQGKWQHVTVVWWQVHEELQVLRGNIRVVCRARPSVQGEQSILAFPMAGALTVSPPDKRISDFEFNASFGPDSTQVTLHASILSNLTNSGCGFITLKAPIGPAVRCCVLNLGMWLQEDVFEEIAPLIRSCVDGYNACIFAYGQTGSGERKSAWPRG